VLRSACEDIARAVRERREITPAAEWLLDNYYLIEAQVADELLAGYARVLGIAREFLALRCAPQPMRSSGSTPLRSHEASSQ